MKKDIIMKRLYSAPEAAFVELATKPLMLVISADRVIIDVENEEAGDETPDLADEYPDLDINKGIKMCLIHDLGEAFTGDIATFYKTDADSEAEDNAYQHTYYRQNEKQTIFTHYLPQKTECGLVFQIVTSCKTYIFSITI